MSPAKFQVLTMPLDKRGTVIRYPSKIGGIDLISPKLFELES